MRASHVTQHSPHIRGTFTRDPRKTSCGALSGCTYSSSKFSWHRAVLSAAHRCPHIPHFHGTLSADPGVTSCSALFSTISVL